jgi:hypothetical protein
MNSYSLRIEGPDTPEAPRNAWDCIRDLGLWPRSFDAEEIEGRSAVLEMTIESERSIGDVADVVDRAGLQLLSICPATGAGTATRPPASNSPADHFEILMAAPEERARVVVAILERWCPHTSAWFIDAADAHRTEAARRSIERGRPVMVLTDALPVVSDQPSWLLAVPDHALAPRSIVLLSRTGSVRFSARELRRASILLAFHRAVSEAPAIH